MNYAQILDEVKRFVSVYFKNHHDDRFVYHNYAHTCDVAAAAERIANHYPLNEEDRFSVLTAAWFHDIGYNADDISNHEERGALMAIDYLRGLQVNDNIIERVKNCILSTKMPQSPQTLIEKIICDADLFHLGGADFRIKSRNMRREFEALKGVKIEKPDWRAKTIYLMEHHQYHTDYARDLLTTTKEQNLNILKEKQKAIGGQFAPLMPPLLSQMQAQGSKQGQKQPTKGRETMFRVASGNHQRLSDMADKKAHIMISVNAIVISLLLSLLLRRLDEHPRQVIPGMLLLTVSLITTVFSVLATRPNVPLGTYTQEDIDNKRVNLLFFGNFYKMSFEQYSAGMSTMMNDHDFLYGSLIRDLYSQGAVLGRKYKLLHIAYSVFMYGLIVSVLAFILSSVI